MIDFTKPLAWATADFSEARTTRELDRTIPVGEQRALYCIPLFIHPAPTSAPEGLHKLVEKWRKAIKDLDDHNRMLASIPPGGTVASGMLMGPRNLEAKDCADELEAALSAAEKGK